MSTTQAILYNLCNNRKNMDYGDSKACFPLYLHLVYVLRSSFVTGRKYIRYKNDGIEYELVTMGYVERVKVGIPGEFTVYNSMAAAVTLL